jgi:glycosyltransferase involved in cell wall biosynthesis
MARFGIDATAVTPAGKGLARVQRKAVESLAALELGHELVVYVRDPEALPLFAHLPVRCIRVPDRLTLVWEQLGLERAVRSERLDAMLTPTERLPVVGRGRYVVWLYELPTHRIAENRRRGASLWQRTSDLVTQLIWRRSLRRAAVVIAGSEATVRELRDAVAGLDARVVHPAFDDAFGPGPADDRGRYVFHLSSSDPRDNTETVLEAFARVRSGLDPAVGLVVGGGLGAAEAPLRAHAADLGIADAVTFTGRLTDDELARLYRGAAAYVDASLYEGFGLQALEAMACGAPVVASSASSIPEVVGDAGLLRDPTDAAAIAEALATVLRDPAEAERLRAAGVARAATFTWTATARGIAAALEAAAGMPG